MNSPIFIISNPRSGSTLLRSILSAHTLISIPHEFPLIEKLLIYSKTRELSNFILLSEYLFSFKHFNDWNISNVELFTVLRNLQEYSVESVSQAIYSLFLSPRIMGKVIWGEKNIGNIGYIDDIRLAFPGAKWIFLVRDPRSVVCSIIKRNWFLSKYNNFPIRFMKSIFGASSLWNDGMDIIKFYNDRLDAHIVKYENLVLRPRVELQDICDFLNIPFERKMLNYQENKHKKLEVPLYRKKGNHDNIGKAINTSSVANYKITLSNMQIALIDTICSENMKIFGYSNNNLKLNKVYCFFSKVFNYVACRVIPVFIRIKRFKW